MNIDNLPTKALIYCGRHHSPQTSGTLQHILLFAGMQKQIINLIKCHTMALKAYTFWSFSNLTSIYKILYSGYQDMSTKDILQLHQLGYSLLFCKTIKHGFLTCSEWFSTYAHGKWYSSQNECPTRSGRPFGNNQTPYH